LPQASASLGLGVALNREVIGILLLPGASSGDEIRRVSLPAYDHQQQKCPHHGGNNVKPIGGERTEGTDRQIDAASGGIDNAEIQHVLSQTAGHGTLLWVRAAGTPAMQLSQPALTARKPRHTTLLGVWSAWTRGKGLPAGKQVRGTCMGQQTPPSTVSPQEINVITVVRGR